MADVFNLTAQINLRGPSAKDRNKVLGDLKKSINGLDANVNIKLNKGTLQSLSTANKRIKSITTSVRDLKNNAKTAVTQTNLLAKSLAAISRTQASMAKRRGNLGLTINKTSGQNITNANKKLVTLDKTLIKVAANAAKATAEMRKFAMAINNIGSTQVTVKVQSAANATKQLNDNAKITFKNLKQTTSQLHQMGVQAGMTVGKFSLMSGITRVIYGLNNAVNDAFADFVKFDRELIKIAQVSGGSISSLSGLKKEITNLSTSLGVSSSSLAEVSVTLTQAGFGVKEVEKALKAIAKTELAPTFNNLNDTVEGSIALLRQFNISASDLEKSLGSINAVAGAFAVESSDIITAIQRAGGVFAAASKGVSEGTDALNEFIAVFTSVRATTRESAETIATGLRTILTRLQRGSTVDALKELNIELRDASGNFIGGYEAIRQLSEGLSRLDPRSAEFAKIAEELGGFRQIGKVIPLIRQFDQAQKALSVAQQGGNSLTEAQIKAQQALSVQFAKTRENFLALIRDIADQDTFKILASSVLALTNNLINLANAIKPILPIIAVLFGGKVLSSSASFLRGFGSGLGSSLKPGARFSKGGLVPGTGNKDSVNASLTPGEVVISKKRVKEWGVQNLINLNKYGPKSFASNKKGKVNAKVQPGEFVLNKKASEAIGYDFLAKANDKGLPKFKTGGVFGRKPTRLTGLTSGTGREISFSAGTVKKLQEVETAFVSLGANVDDLSALLNKTGQVSGKYYNTAMKQLDVEMKRVRGAAKTTEETKKAAAAEKILNRARRAVSVSGGAPMPSQFLGTKLSTGVGGKALQLASKAESVTSGTGFLVAAASLTALATAAESSGTAIGAAGASIVNGLTGVLAVTSLLVPIIQSEAAAKIASTVATWSSVPAFAAIGAIMAPLTIAFGALVAVLGLAAIGFSAWNSYQKKAIELEKEKASARLDDANTTAAETMKKLEKDFSLSNVNRVNTAADAQMAEARRFGSARSRQITNETQSTGFFREFGAWITFGYVDSIEEATANNEGRIREAAREMSDVYAQQLSTRQQTVDKLLEKGFTLEQLQTAPAGSTESAALTGLVEASLQADLEYQRQVAEAASRGKQLSQAAEDAIRSRVREEVLASVAIKSAAEERARNEIKLSLLQKDLAANFERLGSAISQSINRIESESRARQSSIDSLLAAARGQATIQEMQNKNINVLENPNAYTQAERSEARQNIERNLAPALGQEGARSVAALATFDPNAINRAVVDGIQETERLRSQEADRRINANTDPLERAKIEREIQNEFSYDDIIGANIAAEIDKLRAAGAEDAANNLQQQANIISTELASKLNETTDPNERRKLIDESTDKFNQALEQSRQSAINLAKSFEEARTGAFNRFANNLNQINEVFKEATRYYQQALEKRREADDSLGEAIYGFGPSLAELQRRSAEDSFRLTGLRTNDPNRLMGQRSQLDERRVEIEDNLKNNKNLTDDQRAQELENLRAVNIQLDYNRMALEKLAENAEKAAQAILAEIKERKRLQDANVDFAETLLTSGPDELKAMDEALVRANQRLNGFIPQAGSEQRKRFFELLKQTGSVRAASQGVAAETRKKDLDFLRQTKDVRMFRLQSQYAAQGMNIDDARRAADAQIRREQAQIYGQMANEAGLGSLGRNIVGQAIATTADPMNDPVMRQAAEQYKGFMETAAKANEALGKIAENAANEALVKAMYDLKKSLDDLRNNARGVSVPQTAADPTRRSKGGLVYASDGQYIDFTPRGTDTVPAMLTRGEFVVNAKATRQHRSLLESINGGGAKRYKKGGVVYLAGGGDIDREERDLNRPKEELDAEAAGVSPEDAVEARIQKNKREYPGNYPLAEPGKPALGYVGPANRPNPEIINSDTWVGSWNKFVYDNNLEDRSGGFFGLPEGAVIDARSEWQKKFDAELIRRSRANEPPEARQRREQELSDMRIRERTPLAMPATTRAVNNFVNEVFSTKPRSGPRRGPNYHKTNNKPDSPTQQAQAAARAAAADAFLDEDGGRYREPTEWELRRRPNLQLVYVVNDRDGTEIPYVRREGAPEDDMFPVPRNEKERDAFKAMGGVMPPSLDQVQARENRESFRASSQAFQDAFQIAMYGTADTGEQLRNAAIAQQNSAIAQQNLPIPQGAKRQRFGTYSLRGQFYTSDGQIIRNPLAYYDRRNKELGLPPQGMSVIGMDVINPSEPPEQSMMPDPFAGMTTRVDTRRSPREEQYLREQKLAVDELAEQRQYRQEQLANENKLWIESDKPIVAIGGYLGGALQGVGDLAYGAANVVAGAGTVAIGAVPTTIGVGMQGAGYLTGSRSLQDSGRNMTAAGTAFTEIGAMAMLQGAETAPELLLALVGQGPIQRGEQTALTRGDYERREIAQRAGYGVKYGTAFFQDTSWLASQFLSGGAGAGASTGTGILGQSARMLAAVDNAPLGLASRVLGRGAGAVKAADNVITGGRGVRAAESAMSPLVNAAGRGVDAVTNSVAYRAFFDASDPLSTVSVFNQGVDAVGGAVGGAARRGFSAARRGAGAVVNPVVDRARLGKEWLNKGRNARKAAREAEAAAKQAAEIERLERLIDPETVRLLDLIDRINSPMVDKINRPMVDRINRPMVDKINRPKTISLRKAEQIGQKVNQRIAETGKLGIFEGKMVEKTPNGNWRYVKRKRKKDPRRPDIIPEEVLTGSDMLGPGMSSNRLNRNVDRVLSGESPLSRQGERAVERAKVRQATQTARRGESQSSVGDVFRTKRSGSGSRRDPRRLEARNRARTYESRVPTLADRIEAERLATRIEEQRLAPRQMKPKIADEAVLKPKTTQDIPEARAVQKPASAEEIAEKRRLKADEQRMVEEAKKAMKQKPKKKPKPANQSAQERKLADADKQPKSNSPPRKKGIEERPDNPAVIAWWKSQPRELQDAMVRISKNVPEELLPSFKQRIFEKAYETGLAIKLEDMEGFHGKYYHKQNVISIARNAADEDLYKMLDYYAVNVHEFAHFIQNYSPAGRKLSSAYTLDDLAADIGGKGLLMKLLKSDKYEVLRRKLGSLYGGNYIAKNPKGPRELFTMLNQMASADVTRGEFLDWKLGQKALAALWKAEGFNLGGIVNQPAGLKGSVGTIFQPRGTDTVPAMLTRGEFVVNRDAASQHMPLLRAINDGYNKYPEMVNYLAKGGTAGVSNTPGLATSNRNNGVSQGNASIQGIAELQESVAQLQDAVSVGTNNMSQIANSISESSTSLYNASRSIGEATNNIPEQVMVSQNVNVNGIPNTLNEFGTNLLNSSVSQANQNTRNQMSEMNRRNEGSFGLSSPNSNKIIT